MALPAKLLGFERLRFPAQDGVFSKSAIKGVYNHDLLYFSFLQTSPQFFFLSASYRGLSTLPRWSPPTDVVSRHLATHRIRKFILAGLCLL